MNLVVLARGLYEIYHHPDLIPGGKPRCASRGDLTSIVIASALIFPKLALGLSGFETGVSVMPLIRGRTPINPGHPPEGRIRNTQKLLATAALIMSVMLMMSSFVTTLLIPESAYRKGGEASGRAIAYLAHRVPGRHFRDGLRRVHHFDPVVRRRIGDGGLLHLIPRYLPRFGMAPLWVAYPRPLVLCFLGLLS